MVGNDKIGDFQVGRFFYHFLQRGIIVNHGALGLHNHGHVQAAQQGGLGVGFVLDAAAPGAG